jgi:hypothetical protein
MKRFFAALVCRCGVDRSGPRTYTAVLVVVAGGLDCWPQEASNRTAENAYMDGMVFPFHVCPQVASAGYEFAVFAKSFNCKNLRVEIDEKKPRYLINGKAPKAG